LPLPSCKEHAQNITFAEIICCWQQFKLALLGTGEAAAPAALPWRAAVARCLRLSYGRART
jgi:hypothetical protein